MAIYDLHEELTEFYDDHVVLGEARRKKLAGYRDACLERLTTGLELLGKERGRTYRSFRRSIGQGSYPMRTLNQHPKDEYDIDVAVIFAKDDLPLSPLEARALVADALIKAGGNFRKEPEARTNAVTVWYADGAHVDLAVYREVPGILSSTLEHAGPEWGSRDLDAVTEWFKAEVAQKSPNLAATVRKDQLRRVVRWVKRFARSRLSWSLPGGMILTVLVVETYLLDRTRDDVALVRTLQAMKQRLASSLEIMSPIDRTKSLTSKPAIQAQMKSLVEKLEQALDRLSVLEKDDCTRKQALRAWKKVFNHDFWGEAAEHEGPEDAANENGVAALEISVAVAPREGGKGSPYRSAEIPIAKGRWFHFTVSPAWQSAPDVTYKWIVTNTGDEARVANDMGHVRTGGSEEWRHAAYKGVHSMTCEVIRGGVAIARGVRRVHVARW